MSACCEALASQHHVTTVRVAAQAFDDTDWDRLLERILNSDRCITV